jgi:hypothetical protein
MRRIRVTYPNPNIKDGKATFPVVCGRAFGLYANYPGAPKKQGEPTLIAISSGRRPTSLGGRTKNLIRRSWSIHYFRRRFGLHMAEHVPLASTCTDLSESDLRHALDNWGFCGRANGLKAMTGFPLFGWSRRSSRRK